VISGFPNGLGSFDLVEVLIPTTKRRQPWDPSPFDSLVLKAAQRAVKFVNNILESSTTYSVVGKHLDGTIASGIAFR
jgi:hypothetical protein